MRDKNKDDKEMYKTKLLEELLVCVTDRLFSLHDICKVIHILSIFYPENKRWRDVFYNLWFGLIDQSEDMTIEEIVSVFPTLSHPTRSRNMTLRVLQQLKYDSLDIPDHCSLVWNSPPVPCFTLLGQISHSYYLLYI